MLQKVYVVGRERELCILHTIITTSTSIGLESLDASEVACLSVVFPTRITVAITNWSANTQWCKKNGLPFC